ncbi:AMP-binding protein [Pseudomonas aeruginosa]|uniref:AMP-binding protein n=1 Tax=Pseudomonas aeruginosa TaxID=287 RepID=UPI002A69D462|nr:AMP-binding protein [Pseudomonas aeruginosa]MDY1247767.1 hypothetical protein [Pseudomonas aeruginosa]HCF9805911.1 hypothetical protein [Pseudomonas aeruginosa]
MEAAEGYRKMARANRQLTTMGLLSHAKRQNGYTSLMAGAKLVLPGPNVGDAAKMIRLINEEGVTFLLAVPTIRANISPQLATGGGAIPTLRRAVTGGAACPLSLLEAMACPTS